MDITGTAVHIKNNKWVLLLVAAWSWSMTAYFLIFALAPLVFEEDIYSFIRNPDEIYLKACNWVLLLASGSWSLYFGIKGKSVMRLWLIVLGANAILYWYLH